MTRRIALAPLVITMLACCFAPGSTHGPDLPPPPAHPLFDALESHLVVGTNYGVTRVEQRLAEVVHDGIPEYDGVAVQIIPGATVVLVRRDDSHTRGLADMSDLERRAMLTEIASAVDMMSDTATPSAIVIGIRGNVLYGARYRRRIGGIPEYDVGFSVDAEAWVEEALTPPMPVSPGVVSGSAAPGANP